MELFIRIGFPEKYPRGDGGGGGVTEGHIF